MSELSEAAFGYVQMGLSVIALTGKTPNVKVHRHGLKDAMNYATLADVRTAGQFLAFEHPDTTGIGVLTSWPYLVVDIDGEEGAVAWQALAGDDFMPDRWVAKTGRGLHLWFATTEPTGSLKLGTKLDLKGDGGYVAAPPSMHPDGHRYEWLLAPEAPPLEVPERLAALIHARNFDRAGLAVRSAQQKRVRHDSLDSDGTLWASWGFDSIIKGMSDAGDGNRNNYLHWAAAVMAEDGALPEEFEELRETALKAGLTTLEVRRTIRSARRLHAE